MDFNALADHCSTRKLYQIGEKMLIFIYLFKSINGDILKYMLLYFDLCFDNL